MKVEKEFNNEALEAYGFALCNDDYKSDCGVAGNECPIDMHDGYILSMGHSRRGQHYYLLVKKDSGDVSIYASPPDGSGGALPMSNKLVELINIGVIIDS